MNQREELKNLEYDINSWRNDCRDHDVRQVVWGWIQTIGRVRDSLPVTVAGTPEQIKAALRASSAQAMVDASAAISGAGNALAALLPYPQLTPEEAQALICMVHGAPVETRLVQWVTALCAQLLALVAKGARPVDPATLPSWSAEEQLQWLAATDHVVRGARENYYVYQRNDAARPLGPVTYYVSPGEAVQAAMREAFKVWAKGTGHNVAAPHVALEQWAATWGAA